jgi:hemin uptake protein HemP
MNAHSSALPPKASAAPQSVPSTTTGPLRVDSATLMGGQRVLEIMHLGEIYRLQTTRFGKLILTK